MLAPSDGGGAIDSAEDAVDGVPPSDVPPALAVERPAVRLLDGSEAGTTLGPLLGAATVRDGDTAGPDSPTTANVAASVAGATVVTVVLVDAVVTDTVGAETTVCGAGLTTVSVSVSTTGATWLSEESEEDWIVWSEVGELIDLVEDFDDVVAVGGGVVAGVVEVAVVPWSLAG